MQVNNFNLSRKVLHMAVLSSLPLLLAVNTNNANATCTGTLASPVSAAITTECTGAGAVGNLVNTSATDYLDTTTTTTAGNHTLIQFDGQGRTLTNSGIISDNRVITGTTGTRGRTAVLMGAATLNAGTGTLFVTTAGPTLTLPTAGATTVKLNAAPTAAYVGQTIVFGRYNAAEGDFLSAQTRIITAVDIVNKTVTFADPLSADYAGNGSSDPVGYKVVSNFGGGDNIINNSGTISSQIKAAEINGNRSGTTSVSYTAAVKAITASVEGDYVINNSATGIISAKHDGIGNALAIEEGGAVTEMTINNAGLISAERTAALTLVGNTATVTPTATSTSFGALTTPQNIGNVNAINTQEEAEVMTLNNAATGIVRATGDYAGAMYMRAGEKIINNEGLIEYVGTKGFAIGAVSDGGEIRTLELDNAETGTINGDILVTNGNALRYYTLSTAGGAAGLDNRLLINNQWGQSDSDITNAGAINGNFYYANGTHALKNEATGLIVGNIDVDQRDTTFTTTNTCTASATVTCAAAGTTTTHPGDYTNIVTTITNTTTNAFGQNTSTSIVNTVVGSKDFTFENAGTYTGNLTVRTGSGSQVTLVPTITGSGAGSTQAAPSTQIAAMGGTLKIWDGTASSIAATTELSPVVASGVAVKDGAWFKVADNLFGSDLPTIQSSLLVDWTVAKNAAGNLVIGAAVADSSAVAGVTGNIANAINALMTSDDPLAGAVQGLTTSSDIAKAGEQLRPEVNGGSFQAMNKMADQVFGLVENHLAQTHLSSIKGASGISTGESASGNGIWLQGFGFSGEQDRRKSVDGYNIDAYGFAVGADTLTGDGNNVRVGGVLSYGQSNVDHDGVNQGNRTDIDSYQATAYGSYLGDNYYVNGSLGLATHDLDTKRIVLGNAVKGNHDAWQYIAKVDAGWPMEIGKATLMPVASLAYSYLDEDSYSEKGLGALKIKANNTESFRTGLGAKAIVPLYESDMKAALELRAIWNHEFSDTAQDSSARFAAGGSSFNVEGVSQARDSANVGATFHLSGGKDVKQSLLVSYDAEMKAQYTSHTGKITARFDF